MSKYPWQVIDPKDYFFLESTQPLTMRDIHVLTKIYQPIIGGGAYSLYQTLFAELDFEANNKEIMISRMLTKLDVGIPDFYHARIRLEGMGLLQIYQSNTDSDEYFYKLIPPLSAENFFKDSLLRTLLIEKIGNRMFEEILNNLLPKSSIQKNYTDTTRSFLDVYSFNVNNSNVMSNTDFMPIESSEPPKIVETIENVDSFDYNFFKAGLSKHFIREGNLPEEIKELIYTFHVIYGIDELEMQSFILESSDVQTGEVNKNKFIQYVQRSYFNQQKAQGIQAKQQLEEQTTEADDSKINTLGKNEQFLIQHAQQTAPAEYLRSIKEQKNGFVTSNETWILKELVEQSPLRKEVVNVLLHYILVIQGAVILEKNYVMKIANDWAQSDVKSAADAIEKVKELYNENKEKANQPKRRRYSNNYQRQGKKETLPDWAKDQNSNQKQSQESKVSEEEKEAMRARLERIRRMRESKEGN